MRKLFLIAGIMLATTQAQACYLPETNMGLAPSDYQQMMQDYLQCMAQEAEQRLQRLEEQNAEAIKREAEK
jgi:hypothetical protein